MELEEIDEEVYVAKKKRGRKPTGPTYVVDKSLPQETFEEMLPMINELIAKRRNSWPEGLEHILSYEDFSQNLLIHIFNKFSYIDQSQVKVKNYINRLISNQIIKKIRSHFGNGPVPCSQDGCPLLDASTTKCATSCDASECHNCPKFLAQIARKSQSYQARNPSSLDDETFMLSNSLKGAMPQATPNLGKSKQNLHENMQRVLTEEYYDYYDLLYIQHVSDEDFAEIRGYRSLEKRKPGYKRISDIKKYLLSVAQNLLKKEDIIVF